MGLVSDPPPREPSRSAFASSYDNLLPLLSLTVGTVDPLDERGAAYLSTIVCLSGVMLSRSLSLSLTPASAEAYVLHVAAAFAGSLLAKVS